MPVTLGQLQVVHLYLRFWVLVCALAVLLLPLFQLDCIMHTMFVSFTGQFLAPFASATMVNIVGDSR